MLKSDRISSTCDCFQSQVKWNSLPNQTNAHTHTQLRVVFECVLLCVCFLARCACVLRGKVSERSRTRAIPNMTISSPIARTRSRWKQVAAAEWYAPYFSYYRIISFHWLGVDGGWPPVSVRDVRVSYPRWFLLTLFFFTQKRNDLCS